jgi:hypothetical protein
MDLRERINVNEYSTTRKIIKKYQRVNAEIEEVPSHYFRGHWVTIFTHSYTPAVRPLTQRQRQVFDVLTDHICANNYVRMTHTEIAEILGATANSISKAISALCQIGVIYKHHNYVYEIDPSLMWFGKRKNYFEPPTNPSPRTHLAVEILDRGGKKTTLHFPVVLTYEQYQRRYGRLKNSDRSEHTPKRLKEER